jgi:hypothetical protein
MPFPECIEARRLLRRRNVTAPTRLSGASIGVVGHCRQGNDGSLSAAGLTEAAGLGAAPNGQLRFLSIVCGM